MTGGASIRRALSLSFVRASLSLTCAVATVVIVSRLLSPTEVGVYSVAAAVVMLAHMLRDFGISELIVQEKELDPAVMRSAFTVNLLMAWALAALLFASSGWLGDFYGEAGVARVARVLSLVFVVMPFGTVTMACFRREMQFARIVRIQIIETVVGSACTIGLAYAGFSYMSMAWSAVAAATVVALGCRIWGGEFRELGFGLAEWRKVVHFGANRTLADIASQVGQRSADIVVGKMLGVAAAGIYSRGYGPVNMFSTHVIGTISSVAFPAYARDHRDANRAPLLFRKSLIHVTGISWPFFAFIAIMAWPFVRLAFGDQWDAAIPLVRWLCVAQLVAALTYQCYLLLTAMGRYREVTRVVVKVQLVRIALVIAAAFYSLEAVAAVQIGVYAFAALLYYAKLTRYDDLRLSRLAAALLPSALLAVLSCVVPGALVWFWPHWLHQHVFLSLVVAGTGAGALWLAGIFMLRHPLAEEATNALANVRNRLRTMRAPRRDER